MIDIRGSNFTTEYPYVVAGPRTRLIVASGKVNSLFGTAAGKIAKGFMKQVQKARTPGGTKSKKVMPVFCVGGGRNTRDPTEL